jgi:predicted acylesterase/phospholipase RssA
MDPGALSPQSPPENREAVIAIQGGSIYALPMLGQARAILAAGYIPLGFAGNSGGAILATLLWSGLTPNRIEEAFTALLRTDPDGLTNLLLPREPGDRPFRLGDLQALPRQVRELWPLPRTRLGLARLIWRKWQTVRDVMTAVGPHWTGRGVFPGELFVDFLEGLLQEGLGLRQERAVMFGDARRRAARRPPLLLTVTNVSRGCLELIDSTDASYDSVSIAATVRASAGFPLFFRPIDLPGTAAGRCFVDGGMVANFPLWAFSRAFRQQLQRHDDYGWLAPRPWLPIGLRVCDEMQHADVAAPWGYARRLAAIASGMARNDMEDRLVAATQTHALIVTQRPASLPPHPATGKVLDVLDLDAVTASNIQAIIRSGEEAANAALRAYGGFAVYNPECGPAVQTFLENLLQRCEHAMGVAPDRLGLRANIFMAIGQHLEMRFSTRMAGTTDDGLQFPDLATGLNGWSYQTRSPAICNLGVVSAVVGASGGELRPFRMSRRLQDRIEPDRTWLISYPVFDPTERQPLHDAPPAAASVYAPGTRRLQADHIGPILAILNVDAAWDYEELGLHESPDIHVADPRIVAMIDTVAQASLRLARLLIRQPPENGTP